MNEQTQRLNALRCAYGALRAARAALSTAIGLAPAADISDRIEATDEQLRQIARDIAKEVGL